MSAQKDIKIIYASTSGNVEFACETIANLLNEAGYQATLHRAENTPIELLLENNLFLLASSTWEHGEVNPFFNKLLKEMKEADLSGKRALLLGLGDMRYEPVLFNLGIEIVKDRFVESGGEIVKPALKLNGEPYHQVETMIKPWVSKIIEKLQNEG